MNPQPRNPGEPIENLEIGTIIEVDGTHIVAELDAGIAEYRMAHRRTVEPAVGVDHRRSERPRHRGHRVPAGLRELARNGVGIDKRGTVLAEHRGDGALAAPDAAGQANAQRAHNVGKYRFVSGPPKNIAAMPPPAR